MKITVIVPTCRDSVLNEKCLKYQTFPDFEVIVQRPTRPLPKGNFYDLNHDYNLAIKKAKGELIISYQDQIEIKPDCLERFFNHYKMNPQSVVGAVGDQYSMFDPPVKVWTDPRKRIDYGSFYECMPNDIEYTLCAIPKKAIVSAGYFDEEFDKYAALSEKELNYRMETFGYKFYLDQSIEYKAIHHPRLKGDENWDKHYFAGLPYYERCLDEIKEGRRKNIIDF